MKKSFVLTLVALACVAMLVGCAREENVTVDTAETDTVMMTDTTMTTDTVMTDTSMTTMTDTSATTATTATSTSGTTSTRP